MEGSVVIYQIRGLSQAEKAKFRRELYGYTDKSNRGQYEYYRPGLLDEVPYRKLIRGVLLIRKRDKEKISDFMEKYEAEVHIRNVELTREDTEILSSHEN
ncbi:hypothetical protein AKJ40_01685 [candidate division MSBL1 archaeon SCGC-AAA259M10]|uniref:Uncharacterized protein n=1 Tax=candidate division MSBL1 archaeon SCGC-AAA259M10 TaxID=1698270 RepID=A0A133V163_9EURY|nr:hypothetical protein AKJ40_01685 [candidate division MSBL1 archaeon SCGC-AAA259M10]